MPVPRVARFSTRSCGWCRASSAASASMSASSCCAGRAVPWCAGQLDGARLAGFAPDLDPATRPHLEAIERIAAGDPAAGRSPGSGWRSVSTGWSPVQHDHPAVGVHTGLCDDPAAELDHLVATLVGRGRDAQRATRSSASARASARGAPRPGRGARPTVPAVGAPVGRRPERPLEAVPEGARGELAGLRHQHPEAEGPGRTARSVSRAWRGSGRRPRGRAARSTARAPVRAVSMQQHAGRSAVTGLPCRLVADRRRPSLRGYRAPGGRGRGSAPFGRPRRGIGPVRNASMWLVVRWSPRSS